MDSTHRLFLLVLTTNPKLGHNFLWVYLVMVKGQAAMNSFAMFLTCVCYCSAAHDCTTAKKRRAGEQALGVPVNKRKSLLMKPRHYSPSVDCEEGRADQTEAEGPDDCLQTNHHPSTGSEGPGPSFTSLPPQTQAHLRGNMPCGGKAHPNAGSKPDIGFPQHPLARTIFLRCCGKVKHKPQSILAPGPFAGAQAWTVPLSAEGKKLLSLSVEEDLDSAMGWMFNP